MRQIRDEEHVKRWQSVDDDTTAALSVVTEVAEAFNLVTPSQAEPAPSSPSR
jgi:hypothetical protein